VSRTVSITTSYQIQRTSVFDERLADDDPAKPLIDRLFPNVRLSSFSSSLIRDTRDDAVDPSRGEYASASGQLAGRAIGSQIGFAKGFFTAQLFRPIPHTNRIVFADVVIQAFGQQCDLVSVCTFNESLHPAPDH